ncbi:hypothetical protein CEP52_002533 [Fusarium oligoseptatum]|uniref:Uncharacterized protein n=1 Tax=Fusarium oligoseptatum TaxID=2604345 RepID=A0A428UDH2_9HYPO|nr:hypothetical protein CEP52_002533 [Fusarium oligoseptatum]
MLLLTATLALLQAHSTLAGIVKGRTNQDSFVYATKGTISISSDGTDPDILILDYGQNVEGHPTFEVVSTSGDVSGFELTFAESKYAFSNYMSDGPLPLAAAMDNYRVNQYNISKPGIFTNRLIQGAFRYQKLNLSTTGKLRLRKVGVKQTVHTTPLTELPGAFECSDEDLTRIWYTGARTAQLTEIPKDTIPDFWQVTDQGAFVESAAPQALASGVAAQLLSYEIDFEVKPVTGEFSFSVLSDTLNDAIVITCNVVTGVVSATYAPHSGSIPSAADAQVGKWLSVHARVNATEISVSVNNTVLEFSQTTKFFGSFGLGAPFVDGSRRDRIAYTGDLDIALASSFVSTYGTSFIEGSLELLGSYQTTSGFLIPTAKIQQKPREGILDVNVTGLIGYSFNFLNALAQNYEVQGDLAFAKKWAPRIVSMLDWAHSKLENGLFTLSDPSLTGDWNYYDPPQTGASSRFNALYAYALQQTQTLLKDAGVDVSVYHNRLESLRDAIHSHLWNDSLGVYVLTDEIPTGFAQDANAIAVLSGIPQSHGISTKSLLSTLENELQLPAGPLAFSNSTVEAGFDQKISPYASAYHLRAAFESNDTDTVLLLLKTLWAPIANPSHANYTNCFWETLNPDGTPGLGLVTSLCHGWGAGPTAGLSRHVLGVKPVKPGYREWEVKPMALGLSWAKGRVPTTHGSIQVQWKFVSGLLHMKVRGPSSGNTHGIVHLPKPLLTSLDKTVRTVNGKVVSDTTFTVRSSQEVTIKQIKK